MVSEFIEDLPIPYRLIMLIVLLWGMWSAGAYLLLKPEEGKKLEIVVEFKDTVVLHGSNELPIVFDTY